MADSSNRKSSVSKTTKRVSANRAVFGGNYGAKNKTRASKVKSGGSAKSVLGAAVGAAAAAGTARAVKKAVKRSGAKTLAVIFICFIVGAAIGAGVCWFLGKNDKFEMLGEEHIYIAVGEVYADEGVTIKEFGIDLSKRAVCESDLKNDGGGFYAESAGDYYISYTVKSVKFGFIYPVRKIRLVSVIGASEGGE